MAPKIHFLLFLGNNSRLNLAPSSSYCTLLILIFLKTRWTSPLPWIKIFSGLANPVLAVWTAFPRCLVTKFRPIGFSTNANIATSPQSTMTLQWNWVPALSTSKPKGAGPFQPSSHYSVTASVSHWTAISLKTSIMSHHFYKSHHDGWKSSMIKRQGSSSSWPFENVFILSVKKDMVHLISMWNILNWAKEIWQKEQ